MESTLQAPLSYKEELRAWAKVAVPVGLTLLARTGMTMTDVLVLGHYKTSYLTASSLAGIWTSLSFVVISDGFVAALRTFCSQALGADNKKLVGVWFQLACFVCLAACIPIGASNFFAGDIMRGLVGSERLTEEDVANTNTFGKYSAAGLPFYTLYTLMNQWLVSQQIVRPQVVLCVLFLGINVGFNYIFIFSLGGYGLDLGFKGSPLATAASRFCMCVALAVYIFCFSKLHRPTWPGLLMDPSVVSSREPVSGTKNGGRSRCWLLATYMKLALPLALSGILEDGQLQLVSTFAGRIKDHELSLTTHNCIFQIFWFLSSFMWAASSATQVRMGLHLGRNDPVSAKRVMKLSMCISAGIAFAVGCMFFFGKAELGHLYSDDPKIWALSERIATLVAFGYMSLALFYPAFATLSAQGRSLWITTAFFVGAWMVCVPLAYVLTFLVESTKGLVGLWVGMGVGYAIVTIIALIGVKRSNWAQLAFDAHQRSNNTNHEHAPASDTSSAGSAIREAGAEGGALRQPFLDSFDES